MTDERPDLPDRLRPLETARIRAVYLTMALIVAMIAADIAGIADVDLGVFATVVGGQLALLGLGSVVKLVGK